MLGLHFTPACVLLSACSLHFTLSLHFTHGRQSAFYNDRLQDCQTVTIPLNFKGACDRFFIPRQQGERGNNK